YLGAVGYPGVPDSVSLRDLLIVIRREFDQYVNLRPIQLLDGAPCPIYHGSNENINMTFIRENSEGEYAGAGEWLYKGKPEEVVLQTSVFSGKGTEGGILNPFELPNKEKKT